MEVEEEDHQLVEAVVQDLNLAIVEVQDLNLVIVEAVVQDLNLVLVAAVELNVHNKLNYNLSLKLTPTPILHL